MFKKFYLLIFLLASMSGCATSRGFDHGALRGSLEDQAVVTDKEIKKTLKLKPQLPKPFKLGIYFKEERYATGTEKWHWTTEDKDKTVSFFESFKNNKQVDDVFLINEITVPKTDLPSIRLAAAQHGADAVIVLNAMSDVDSYTNDLAAFYFFIIPALFVHGSQVDALFITHAAMWDVKNGYLYLTAEAVSEKREIASALSIDKRKVLNEAKAEAMDRLGAEISKTLSQRIKLADNKSQ